MKEKFAAPTAASPLELAALGMMIKRAPGFDSTAGDWEFVYWNATDEISQGSSQLPTCTTCHAGTAATDFVFANSNWRQPATP